MLRRFMVFWVLVLPLPLCLALAWAWYRQTHCRPFVLHVLLVPFLYGYIVPGIATNILHRWHFKGPMLLGRYYVHHGFIYAGNMGALLLIPFLGQSPEDFTLPRALSIVLSTAALHGFVLWLHDIGIVKLGMVELFNRPARQGRSPEEIVTYYAPLCFSLLGAAYAAGAALAYEFLVVRHCVGLGIQAELLAVGIGLTFTIPSLAYRWVE